MTNRQPEDMHGLFAGQFEPEDYMPYVRKGILRLEYRGLAGFLGLATLVQVFDQKEGESQ